MTYKQLLDLLEDMTDGDLTQEVKIIVPEYGIYTVNTVLKVVSDKSDEDPWAEGQWVLM